MFDAVWRSWIVCEQLFPLNIQCFILVFSIAYAKCLRFLYLHFSSSFFFSLAFPLSFLSLSLFIHIYRLNVFFFGFIAVHIVTFQRRKLYWVNGKILLWFFFFNRCTLLQCSNSMQFLQREYTNKQTNGRKKWPTFFFGFHSNFSFSVRALFFITIIRF